MLTAEPLGCPEPAEPPPGVCLRCPVGGLRWTPAPSSSHVLAPPVTPFWPHRIAKTWFWPTFSQAQPPTPPSSWNFLCQTTSYYPGVPLKAHSLPPPQGVPLGTTCLPRCLTCCCASERMDGQLSEPAPGPCSLDLPELPACSLSATRSSALCDP